MPTILLVILIYTNGVWYIPDGYSPREQPSMEVCERRAAFVRATINGRAVVDCVEEREK